MLSSLPCYFSTQLPLLVFSMKRPFSLCRLSLFAVALFALLAPAVAADAKRPNILWLITEDMGPELACYGTPEVSTPVLDELARKGMRFENAFTVTPVCSTSRSSFCTGMYAITIGAHQHRTPGNRKQMLPEGVKPVTHWLKEAGYFTANMAGGKSLDRGGKVDWNFKFEGKAFDGHNWDELKANQPFYAQINHSQSHRGWSAPAHADPAKVEIPPYYPDHPLIRKDWAQYLDEVTEVDALIGDVLKRLEKDGLADNTIIFMFGDHGRAHMRGKQWCYDSGLRIPCILYVPPSLPVPAGYEPGKVETNMVESIDITATTLALAGIKKPAKMQGRVLYGEQREEPRKVAVASRDRCDMTMFRIRTARDAEYRYVRNFMPELPFLNINVYKETSYPMIGVMRKLHEKGELDEVQDKLFDMTRPAEELYRIGDDPYEIHNLAESTDPKDQAALKRLRAEVAQWIKTADDQGAKAEPMSVRLDYFESGVGGKKRAGAKKLVQSIIEQQRKSPGISREYSDYLDAVEKRVFE